MVIAHVFATFLLFFTLITYSFQNMGQMIKYEMECLKDADMKFSDLSFDNANNKQMCFVKCVGVKAGFFDQSGKYIEGSAEQKLRLSNETITRAKECTNANKDDPCENAFEFLNCVRGKLNLSIRDFIAMI